MSILSGNSKQIMCPGDLHICAGCRKHLTKVPILGNCPLSATLVVNYALCKKCYGKIQSGPSEVLMRSIDNFVDLTARKYSLGTQGRTI